MSKLIPKHLKGKPIIPKYYGAYDYKKDKWILPAFNDNGETHITLPNIEITPRNTNLTEVIDKGRNAVGKAIYNVSTYATPTGDALDVFLVKKDLLNGNYGLAALGAGLLLLPNIIEKPIKGLVRSGKKLITAKKRALKLSTKINLNLNNMEETLADINNSKVGLRALHYTEYEKYRNSALETLYNHNQYLNFSHLTIKSIPTASLLSPVNLDKMSDTNLRRFIKKYFPIDVKYINDDFIYQPPLEASINRFVTEGQYSLPIFGTNTTINGVVKSGPFNSAPIHKYDIRHDKITTDASSNFREVSVPTDYVKGLQSNINYLTIKFPGFKPFGSAVGVTQGGLPHVTHDIDGFITSDNFDKISGYTKTPYRYDDLGNPITYKINIGKLYGDAGDIDFNIILKDPKTGLATGKNALELYLLLFPDEYEKALLKAADSNLDNPADIFINKTPDELLAAYDPVTKTILDSFEINYHAPNKLKHAGRPLVYLSYGNPEAVSKGLLAYARSYLGTGVLLAPKIDRKYFENPENNQFLLKVWGIPGDHIAISLDPAKMLNALDYWVLNNTVLGRGVNSRSLPNKNISTLKTALTTWDPKSIGGNANGAGLNTVTFGNSNHGNYYGFLQPKLLISGLSTPESITNALLHLFGRSLFGPDELNRVKNILNKHGISPAVNSPVELLDVIPPAGETSDKVLKDLSNELGIDAINKEIQYGTGNYTSTTRPFNLPTDRVFLTYNRTRPNSILDRAEAIILGDSLNDVSKFAGNFRCQLSFRPTSPFNKYAYNPVFGTSNERALHYAERKTRHLKNLLDQLANLERNLRGLRSNLYNRLYNVLVMLRNINKNIDNITKGTLAGTGLGLAGLGTYKILDKPSFEELSNKYNLDLYDELLRKILLEAYNKDGERGITSLIKLWE